MDRDYFPPQDDPRGEWNELGRQAPLHSGRPLTGLFPDRTSAGEAYQITIDKGYTPEEINLFMSGETRDQLVSDDRFKGSNMGSRAMEGTGAGAALGGGMGAIAGIVAAIGTSIVIPGLGVVIAGPVAAGLAGAGAGGITGGVIGALVGAGVPKESAEKVESGLREGRIVMSVTPKSDADAMLLENEWRAHKGEQIHH